MNTLVLSTGQRNKITIEVHNEQQSPIHSCEFKFTKDCDYKQAAKEIGIDKAEIYKAIGQFRQTGNRKYECVGQSISQQNTFRVRALKDSSANAIGFQSIREIITTPITLTDPVIEWDDRKAVAALDVDFHEYDMDNRPSQERLENVARTIQPVPFCFWHTRGKGYRLLYQQMGDITAEELAAVATISLREIEPGATFEIKRATRYPPGIVGFLEPSANCDVLSGWFNETQFDVAEANLWLSNNGYVIGERYEHDKCPGKPDNRISRRPVIVYSDHIFCHLCNHYYSFASLTGRRLITSLRKAVKNLTHWQHAQYMVESATELTGEIAMLAYSAAVKIANPGDERIPAVFTAGKDLIRFGGHWATPHGESMRDASLGPVLATLPACRDSVDNKPIPAKVALFTQPIDLSEYGYTVISPIWGIKIDSRKDSQHERSISVVMQNALFSRNKYAMHRARYIPAARRRISVESSMELLQSVFPGLHHNTIRLYIAAKGLADSESGPPVMIIVSGPTSSGKTITVNIAAAICADTVFPVRGLKDEQRLRDAIRTGKQQGSFIFFDEVVKDAKKDNASVVDSLSFLLNLTPNSLSHKLFTGAVPLGRIPVCIFSDTFVPTEIAKDAQLSRRLIHVHMPHRVEWQDTIQCAGIGKIENLRLHSLEFAEACNIIVSDVMDEFFTEPMTFLDIAKKLGFDSLENSEVATESREELLRFYDAVCAAPPLQKESDIKRWRGEGWKLIDRDVHTPLTECWDMMCDGMARDQYVNSRKCTEIDWQLILNSTTPIIVDIRPHGLSRLAIRFRSTAGTQIKPITNGDIERVYKANSVQLEPSSNGVHRPGDTIDTKFEESWFKSLPNGSIHAPDESSRKD